MREGFSMIAISTIAAAGLIAYAFNLTIIQAIAVGIVMGFIGIIADKG